MCLYELWYEERRMWIACKQGIAEALMKAGAVYKYDLSFPVKDLYSLVDELRRRLGELAEHVCRQGTEMSGGGFARRPDFGSFCLGLG